VENHQVILIQFNYQPAKGLLPTAAAVSTTPNINGTDARTGNINNTPVAGPDLGSIGPTSTEAEKAAYSAAIVRALGQ
jgi:hypothetical protein